MTEWHLLDRSLHASEVESRQSDHELRVTGRGSLHASEVESRQSMRYCRLPRQGSLHASEVESRQSAVAGVVQVRLSLHASEVESRQSAEYSLLHPIRVSTPRKWNQGKATTAISTSEIESPRLGSGIKAKPRGQSSPSFAQSPRLGSGIKAKRCRARGGGTRESPRLGSGIKAKRHRLGGLQVLSLHASEVESRQSGGMPRVRNHGSVHASEARWSTTSGARRGFTPLVVLVTSRGCEATAPLKHVRQGHRRCPLRPSRG